MKRIELTVEAEKPLTLERFLMGRKGVSRRLLTRLKRTEGGMTRNGEPIRSIDEVRQGDIIVLSLGDDSFLEPNGGLKVPIAYENDRVAVFDKPSGMPVHPSMRHQGDTLGNYFAFLYPGITFRSVNRLDRDTSGLCVTAKDALAAKLLQGSCRKVYYAAVHGEIPESGTIDAHIARERESIILRCVRGDGQRAVTHFRRILCSGKYSLAEIFLETGRTHQIRVHFAHIGAPLAGDDLYGGLRDDISRQALHCGRISFADPLTGEPVTVSSELPGDIKSLFKEEI